MHPSSALNPIFKYKSLISINFNLFNLSLSNQRLALPNDDKNYLFPWPDFTARSTDVEVNFSKS